MSAEVERLDATVPVLVVKTASIALQGNRVRMTRHPIDAAQTGILGPDSERRSSAFLLNHVDGVKLHPSRKRRMTVLDGSLRSKISSPHIQTHVKPLPKVPTMRSISLLISSPLLTPRLVDLMPQRDKSHRIYNSNRIFRFKPNHSATAGGTLPQIPTCTSPRLVMFLPIQRRQELTSISTPRLSLDHL